MTEHTTPWGDWSKLNTHFHEIGLNGHLVAMNPAGLSMLVAMDEGEIVGRVLWDFVTPAHRPRVERLLNGAFAGRPADFEFNTTHDRIYQSSFVPIHDARGAVVKVMGLTIDITERKQAEEQARLHHAELAHVMRISVASELAMGLAHELNQPLTAMVNYTERAMRRVREAGASSPELIEAMDGAVSQAFRATEIVRRLAKFVQKHSPQQIPFAINDAVNDVLGLSAAEARDHRAVIRVELGRGNPTVMADNIQIQQVILNHVRNGLEAMAENETGERVLTIRTSVAEHEVVVAVTDRGPGLGLDALRRVFEPFFTTKPNGMGLGLSISRSIVDAQGGRLWVENNRAGGATFQLTLPLVRAQAGCKD